MTTELKPDNSILVVSGNDTRREVKVESFPIGTNLLTPQEAREQGLSLPKKSKKEVAVWCGGIASCFNEYRIMTSTEVIEKTIKNAEKSCEAERKRIWVSITRQLHKHTAEQLNAHYERNSQEWRDWCDDCVLWYAYNAILFKKGIPVMEMSAEDKARAR
jgi:hypothetical protein